MLLGYIMKTIHRILKRRQLRKLMVLRLLDDFKRHKGFDLYLKYCNNYDLWMKIALSSNVTFLPEMLSFERKHHNQATILHSKEIKDIEIVIKSLKNKL
jgi:hypothetical protein